MEMGDMAPAQKKMRAEPGTGGAVLAVPMMNTLNLRVGDTLHIAQTQSSVLVL